MSRASAVSSAKACSIALGVAGEIFAAPGPPRCLEALRLADRGTVFPCRAQPCRRRLVLQHHARDGCEPGAECPKDPDSRRYCRGTKPRRSSRARRASCRCTKSPVRRRSKVSRSNGAWNSRNAWNAIRERSLSPFARQPILQPVNPSSSLAMMTWKWAWASMEKPAPAA